MKPTKFKLIMNNDSKEFEEEINEALKDGFNFLGEYSIKEGVFIQPMVKVEMIMPAPVPQAEKKGNK